VLITSHGLYWSNYTAPLSIELVQSFLPVLLWIILSFIRTVLSYHLVECIWWNAKRLIGYPSSRHLVVHVFIRTGAFFRHLVCTTVLCTTPEAVVVLVTQIFQNATQTLHGLARRSSVIVRGRKDPALTFKERNCAASSIVSGAHGALFGSTFFGRSPSSSSGTSISACICMRSRSCIELSPSHAGVTDTTRASMRPGGKDSVFVGLSQNTLNCGSGINNFWPAQERGSMLEIRVRITSLPARSSRIAQVCWAGASRASARRSSYSRRVRSLKDSLSVSSATLAALARRSSSVGEGARLPRPMPFLPVN
jgi:hypothetical protein